MSNLWHKQWSWSLEKFEQCLLTKEFLKQYLTEKQNSYLQSGHLQEVIAYEKSTLGESYMHTHDIFKISVTLNGYYNSEQSPHTTCN